MSEHSAERLLEFKGAILVTGLRVRVFVQQRARVSLDSCELTAAHDDPLIVGPPNPLGRSASLRVTRDRLRRPLPSARLFRPREERARWGRKNAGASRHGPSQTIQRGCRHDPHEQQDTRTAQG
jgi:hypothetical protein